MYETVRASLSGLHSAAVVSPASARSKIARSYAPTTSTRTAARSTRTSRNDAQKPCSEDRCGSTASVRESASSRRHLLLSALTCASGLVTEVPEAQAIITVRVDGVDVEAYEVVLSLDVTALKGSVPNEWPRDFKQALGPYGELHLNQKGQLIDIYKGLGAARRVETGWFGRKKRTVAIADAVTLGDSWLGPAIKAGYLQPLQDVTGYRWWDALSPQWKKLVTRDATGQLDSKGQVWAVPYRWGCNLVAYTPSFLCRRGGVPIQDWTDLLQPRLEGRLGFLDSPRDFLGVAFKTLGLPFNCSHAQLHKSNVSSQQLKSRLKQLRQQVRVFSSREHTRAMLADDVWAIVGSSQDLLPLAMRSSTVTVVAPTSGVALWADFWAVPAGASGGAEGLGPSPLLPAWFEFALMPNRLQPSRGLQEGASPLQLPSAASAQDLGAVGSLHTAGAELLNGVMPAAETLLRSEFLLPLDHDTTALYNDLLTL